MIIIVCGFLMFFLKGTMFVSAGTCVYNGVIESEVRRQQRRRKPSLYEAQRRFVNFYETRHPEVLEEDAPDEVIETMEKAMADFEHRWNRKHGLFNDKDLRRCFAILLWIAFTILPFAALAHFTR